MSKTVVVLGAGVGGLTAAAELRGVLPASDRIVLVDHSFTSSLGLSRLWVLRGWRSPEQVTVGPTPASLPGVTMVTAEVDHIDVDARTVHCQPTGPIRYDALIVALGAALDTATVPGLARALECGAAGQFYTLDGAARLHHRIEAIGGGRVMVLVTGVPFSCPAAPFEAAFLIADQLGEKFSSGAARIDVFTPDPLPMPVAGPEVGNALVGMLRARGIGFNGEKLVARIDPEARTAEFADGTTESFDLLAVVPRHASPAATMIPTRLGAAGWIPVDAQTLTTAMKDVWAIGDVTALKLPSGKPLPKAAIFAQTEAEVAAHQVARHFGYDAPDTRLTGDGACYIEIGGRLAAKGEGDFLTLPAPRVALHEPAAAYHREKEQQERNWLARWNIHDASGTLPRQSSLPETEAQGNRRI